MIWRKEENKADENRQRNKEAEEADRVFIAPGVTAGKLRLSGRHWLVPYQVIQNGAGCTEREIFFSVFFPCVP